MVVVVPLVITPHEREMISFAKFLYLHEPVNGGPIRDKKLGGSLPMPLL